MAVEEYPPETDVDELGERSGMYLPYGWPDKGWAVSLGWIGFMVAMFVPMVAAKLGY